ncbi:hypothetical protein [Adhaeribacter radiodurans]|uniref:HNH endonuclease n=1 Tax=Adhaeribacter radiodurans TaxID=2745197 RepID=A0A7L7LCD7_9BACT|nr:hypothetical protein [Adhaeribacter radiodurans]QMU30508.1 hypothetical protein HUW48_21890 [Adhaeribacter radiodurans]
MIYINSTKINPNWEWIQKARELTDELQSKITPSEKMAFIEANRENTWGNQNLRKALIEVIGNKCWYSEVPLEGADSNIDHFRPKGRVVEIDCHSLEKTGEVSIGYWWLAFDHKNFRLSCIHSNQRRVDNDTEGGKADFFPVRGERAPEGTELALIREDVLPIDPCSKSDMALIWFGPDGNLGIAKPTKVPTPFQEQRIKITNWLFHLNKQDVHKRRVEHMEEVRIALKNADTAYKLWNPESSSPDLSSKSRFDSILDDIERLTADNAPFAGAKRCAVALARLYYFTWMDEYLPNYR